ncbi:hypothetical protein AGMMS49975_15790 [Clostridia bacterium]|nr:hypothetical protein AGMMS49975_15790 [Clostridia bacterium]
MLCRVCGKDTDNSKYCYFCGWLNGSVSVITTELNAYRNNVQRSSITLCNEGNSPVCVQLSLIDDKGVLSFAEYDGAVFDVVKSTEIGVLFDFSNYEEDTLDFAVCVLSNDDAPDYPVLRPYKIDRYRTVKYNITVTISSSLILDRDLILFNQNAKKQYLTLENNGNFDINIDAQKTILNVSSGFRMVITHEVINPYATESILFEATTEESEILGKARIFYAIGESKLYEDIFLYVRDSRKHLGAYDYVFGTYKDNVVCVDAKTGEITEIKSPNEFSKFTENNICAFASSESPAIPVFALILRKLGEARNVSTSIPNLHFEKDDSIRVIECTENGETEEFGYYDISDGSPRLQLAADIENAKYTFLFGDEELVEDRHYLLEGFVYTIFDFFEDRKVCKNCAALGTTLKYSVNNTFGFDIRIAPKNHFNNDKLAYVYHKNDSLKKCGHINLSSRVVRGEWLVSAFIEEKWYRLKSFYVDIECERDYTLRIEFSIFNDEFLKISIPIKGEYGSSKYMVNIKI